MSWPKEITWPMPSQFCNMAWVQDKHGSTDRPTGDGYGYPIYEELADLPAHEVCGSKFCLVGWVRHEFGLPANPHTGGQLPREGVRILRCVVEELSGQPIGEVLRYNTDEISLADWIARKMDDDDNWLDRRRPMSPRAACELMRRVLMGLGYEPQ